MLKQVTKNSKLLFVDGDYELSAIKRNLHSSYNIATCNSFLKALKEDCGNCRAHDGNGLGFTLANRLAQLNGIKFIIKSKKNELNFQLYFLNQNLRNRRSYA